MTAIPRLSILFPAYNGENFPVESIETLLGQSYETVERIISDNAALRHLTSRSMQW
jgi:glycosyltransferase involved in cell wall biosynthesis